MSVNIFVFQCSVMFSSYTTAFVTQLTNRETLINKDKIYLFVLLLPLIAEKIIFMIIGACVHFPFFCRSELHVSVEFHFSFVIWWGMQSFFFFQFICINLIFHCSDSWTWAFINNHIWTFSSLSSARCCWTVWWTSSAEDVFYLSWSISRTVLPRVTLTSL